MKLSGYFTWKIGYTVTVDGVNGVSVTIKKYYTTKSAHMSGAIRKFMQEIPAYDEINTVTKI